MDLLAIFSQNVLCNITTIKNSQKMTDIALIEKLADKGAFGKAKDDEELTKIKAARRNLYNDWRSGKSKSYLKMIELIADILNVSVESLCVFELKPEKPLPRANEQSILPKTYDIKLTEQEMQIISCFRSMDLKEQSNFLSLLISDEKKDD